MSGAHAHALYVHGHSLLHRMAPEAKIAAQFAFVLIVVSTPREAFWAFGLYALIVAGLVLLARLPVGFVAKRLVFEVPFIAFALFLPFIGQGERVQVGPLTLSVEGLWGMWNIVAKATLGLAISIVIAATTTMTEFLRGFDALHLPRIFVGIAGFMVRYADVIGEEMRRMKVARESRGYDPRWIWQVKAVAAGAGALFIRAYERGERVYLAMISRGYEGSMPQMDGVVATRAMWLEAAVVPAVALVICATAWMMVG